MISLARELRALGLDARFAGDTVRPGENLGEHLAQAGVPWEDELRLSRKVRIGDVLHDVRLLTGWARSGRFDVFHAGFAHDHFVSLLAARRARNPDLRLVRAVQRRTELEPGFFDRRLRVLRRSDGVVVHSESYRQLLLKHLPIGRVAYVPGAVDAHWFTPGRAPELRGR